MSPVKICERLDTVVGRSRRNHGEYSMQLVFLSAWQDPRPDAAVDLQRQEMLLADALRSALDSATMAGTVSVKFCPRELTVWIYTADATRAFTTVAPILRGSSYCAAGYVLLKCGPSGARERQIKLSDVPISVRPGERELGG